MSTYDDAYWNPDDDRHNNKLIWDMLLDDRNSWPDDDRYGYTRPSRWGGCDDY